MENQKLSADDEAQIEYLENWKKSKEEKKRKRYMKRHHLRVAKMYIKFAVNEIKLLLKEGRAKE